MSAVGDRASAHFKSLVYREPLEVPEWGDPGEPLMIYGKPVSVADAQAIFTSATKSNFDMFVQAMIRLAVDKDGKQLFDIGDKPNLRRSSHEIVERIGSYLLKSRDESELNPDFEITVKN